MITVVFFLWTDSRTAWGNVYKYDVGYVSRMISMLDRNLTVPHEYVLATDRPSQAEGLPVRIVELDNSLFMPAKRFQKLMIWRPDAEKIFGKRILMIDLDLVILKNIDSMVSRGEDVVLWRNPTFRDNTPYNTSMVLLKAGSRPHVWTEFDIKHSPTIIHRERRSGTDQAWVSRMLSPNEAVWTEKDGFLSFRKSYLQTGDINVDEARVVSFHGRISPFLKHLKVKYPWILEHYR